MSNGIYLFYLIACIPAIVGLILFLKSKQVAWQEWAICSAVAFVVSGVMHITAFYGMTDDIEMLSGQITSVTYSPAWSEFYTETHTRTVGSGKDAHTEVYTDTHTAYHPNHWDVHISYGEVQNDVGIDQSFFNEVKGRFGGSVSRTGRQAGWHGGMCTGGDRHNYSTDNATGYVYPTTKTQHFVNKIKAAPTVFSYTKVPTNIQVHAWPASGNWLQSSRVIGAPVTPRAFDLMCSRLGPSKLVNVVLINFGSQASSIAQWQEAAWVGGKKNDLVLCYGSSGTNTTWSRVFGWTERDVCKRNLESILLKHSVDDTILPLVEAEIKASYVIKDWTKFDYITIEPPMWAYIVLIIMMISTQIGLWCYALTNAMSKEDNPYGSY